MNPSKARSIATVHGRVVGVGFRDYVVGLARRHAVAGNVKNARSNDVVEIDVEGEPDAIDTFLRDVEMLAHSPARVDRIERREAEFRGAAGFRRTAPLSHRLEQRVREVFGSETMRAIDLLSDHAEDENAAEAAVTSSHGDIEDLRKSLTDSRSRFSRPTRRK